MVKKIGVSVAVMISVSACVAPAPVVSDYNGASVKIQQNIAFNAPDATASEVISEAQRICGTAGKRAEYASTTQNSQNYTATHLFLCL